MKIEDNTKQSFVKFSEIAPGHVFKEHKQRYNMLCMKMDETLKDSFDNEYNAIGIELGITIFIPVDELVEPIENIKVVIE